MKDRNKIYMIMLIVIVLDQVIKLVVSHTMRLYQVITIISNFFSITYLKNTGAAFSKLEDNIILLIIIGVLAFLSINYYIKRENKFNKLSIISLGFVMGGIFGNLIDRIVHRGVIDYLSFNIFNYDFPVFNLADITITVGTLLYFISVIIEEKRGG